jgi:riboflavin kinase / FMN adenylyltransferase
MMLARSFDDLALDLPVLLTIGTFDGVHRGHRLLLEQARQRADERRLALVIVTFEPSPAVVLRPGLRRYQLSAAEIKIRLLQAFNPDCILLLPFTLALSRLSAGEFMNALEARLTVRELWLGEDFHFGRDREGDARMLAERGARSGFALHVVERRADDPGGISSSRIRGALAEGDVELALKLLGYPFCLELGTPKQSDHLEGLGRTVYDVPDMLAIPDTGAYAVLLTTSGGSQLAAACVVDAEADSPLTVVGERDGSEPVLLEFIARLSGETAEPNTLLDHYHQAVAVAAQWSRPTYPPAGSHT